MLQRSNLRVVMSALLIGHMNLTMVGCASSTPSSAPPGQSGSTPIAEAQPKQTPNSSESSGAQPEKTEAPASTQPTAEVKPKSQSVPSSKTSASSEIAMPDIPQDKVISAVKADWNGDSITDRAILTVSEADATETDLLIYLSDPSQKSRLALSKRNVAWRGAMYGTQPSLSVNPQGSLVINSANDAIGRDRWSKKITAMYENGEFVVAGYTYSYHDTLDLAVGGTCDVNLLTGRGVKNNQEFRTTLKPMNLENWTEDSEPKECNF
ncbi:MULTISPECIES: hypothetical protein [unclassified Leptolyngbya]|uniref:hypothetical protein n=1 Tax=unclassified Leptolyngbya TaxID=2650499 RepID=UPI001AD47D78|nr:MULTISPECIES: hypothetical protein [unclassified Leptolyngbya]MBN8564147.1 hypothetical protein [Leptolyngbya sp. UWPOB_LEPTO1]MCY6492875.1 hypothetical protein [Leptolyngbya sp. GGD]